MSTPLVDVREETFSVLGSTREQLASSIAAVARPHGAGRHAAVTTWTISWEVVGRVARVCAEIVVVTPRWRPSRFAPVELLEEWSRFVAALRAHEQGHVDLAVEAAKALQGALDALPRADADEARRLASSILDHARGRELRYDADTLHGARQGAVFTARRSSA